jgi:ribosomal protein S18 acetylase RimI-like enzyme
MAPIVREARPDDYPAVADITVAAYRSAAPDGEVPAALRPGGHFEEVYAPALRDVASRAAHAVVLVAETGGVVLGAVTYVSSEGPYAEFDESDSAGVRHLAVDPASQGTGTGRALMEECLARARRDGKRRIVLHTQPHMYSARALYARMGFVRAPERDFRPAPDIDLEGYVLDL